MRYWSRHAIEQAVAESGLERPKNSRRRFLYPESALADLDLLSSEANSLFSGPTLDAVAAAVFPVLTRLADSLWIEARSSEACNK